MTSYLIAMMEAKTKTTSKSKHRKQKTRTSPFKRFYELICDKRKRERAGSSSDIPETRDAHGSLVRGDERWTQNHRQSITSFGDSETLEDEIRIPSPGYMGEHDAGTIIIQFHDKDQMDDDDENSSILKQTPSIETEYIRPAAACCYCSEGSIPKSATRKRSSPKKNTTRKRRIRNDQKREIVRKAEMKSMLSDDDDKENGKTEDGIDENGLGFYDMTGFTVEECEARFMQELESSQCENYNLENSHWRKGFEFVRS